MKRMFGAAVVGLFAVAVAQAHFAFIVPESDGSAAKVIFSDELAPDPDVNITKIESTKLFVRDAGGKDTPLEMQQGQGFYSAKVPGSGPRVVYGVTEYGVLQKGDGKPFRLTYLSKAVVGGAAAKPVGSPLKVEVLPETTAGKTRFRVVYDGKPAPEAETTVFVPGVGKKPVKTDKDGFTPAFEPAGRYGVFTRVTEAKPGEYAGREYTETRYYATLVIDVGK